MSARPFWRLSLASLVIINLLLADRSVAQVSSGSNGSDGVLNPNLAQSIYVIIDMHDHPDGIYQYTSVNIPDNAVVEFIPNAANTPVVWLVQGDCTIGGQIILKGSDCHGVPGAAGGPGGFPGGMAAINNDLTPPGSGAGPGGGKVAQGLLLLGGNASYGTMGETTSSNHPPGDIYGNQYLLPLIGGSGGSGSVDQIPNGPYGQNGGGGGGGAILIAVSNNLVFNGSIITQGGSSNNNYRGGGGGSGGAMLWFDLQ